MLGVLLQRKTWALYRIIILRLSTGSEPSHATPSSFLLSTPLHFLPWGVRQQAVPGCRAEGGGGCGGRVSDQHRNSAAGGVQQACRPRPALLPSRPATASPPQLPTPRTALQTQSPHLVHALIAHGSEHQVGALLAAAVAVHDPITVRTLGLGCSGREWEGGGREGLVSARREGQPRAAGRAGAAQAGRRAADASSAGAQAGGGVQARVRGRKSPLLPCHPATHLQRSRLPSAPAHRPGCYLLPPCSAPPLHTRGWGWQQQQAALWARRRAAVSWVVHPRRTSEQCMRRTSAAPRPRPPSSLAPAPSTLAALRSPCFCSSSCFCFFSCFFCFFCCSSSSSSCLLPWLVEPPQSAQSQEMPLRSQAKPVGGWVGGWGGVGCVGGEDEARGGFAGTSAQPAAARRGPCSARTPTHQ